LLARFDKAESGILVEYLLMLRNDKHPYKTITLYGKHKELHEFWSGFVNSQDEYQAMMVAVNKFIEEYKNNLGAI